MRGWRPYAFICLALVSSACVAPSVTDCGNGVVCPAGTSCDTIHNRCVAPDQLETCVDRNPGDACPIGGDAAAGVCQDGVCVEVGCGDGQVRGSEECDGPLAEDRNECQEHGFAMGTTVSCRPDCTLDFTGCSDICGDNMRGPGEDCDGDDLGDATSCTDYDFYDPAPLKCNALCRHDISMCTGACGDGVKNGPEDCDGTDFGTSTCLDLGYYSATTLQCDSLCRFVETQCQGFCGDLTVNDASEVCDGSPPTGEACIDYGFDVGGLGCSTFCTPAFAGCSYNDFRQVVMPTNATLDAISIVSPTLMFAVGTGGTVLRFDGVSWTAMSPTPTTNFTGVYATAANNVWAVGPNTIARYDGTIWTSQTFSGVTFSDINGSAADNVFVTGWTTQSTVGVIYRYTGSSWAPETIPGAGQLHSIWVGGTNLAYAVGSGGIMLAYNGTWSTVAGLPAKRMWSVRGSSATDILAGGDDGLILHYDGLGWTTQPIVPALPVGNNFVRAVWSNGPRDHYALASGHLLHDSGDGWMLIDDTTSGFGYLLGASGPGDIWAMGRAPGTLIRGRGRSWEVNAATDRRVANFWGSHSNDVFAFLGNRIFHFDGTTWAEQVVPLAAGSIGDMWGVGPNEVWTVGEGGDVMRTLDGGLNWTLTAGVSLGSLTGVWGSGSDNVWGATDDASEVIHFDGAVWTRITVPTGEYAFRDVWGSGPSDVYFVASDTVVHYDGQNWDEAYTANAGDDILGIWGTGPDDIFITVFNSQAGNRIVHYDGVSWTDQYTTPSALFTIWGSAPDDVYAAVNTVSDLVYHYDGTTWTPVRWPYAGALWGTSRTWFASDFQDSTIRRLDVTTPWSCRATETACGDGVDDDCDHAIDSADSDCAGRIQLNEVFGGSPDYIELINRGTVASNLSGLTLTFRMNATAVQSFTFPTDAIVQPGGVFRVEDQAGDVQHRERFALANIADNVTTEAWVALCAGPCDLVSCSNFLDYFEKSGATAVTAPPACADFTPAPLVVTGATATQSATRTGFTGSAKVGAAADWALATSTRN